MEQIQRPATVLCAIGTRPEAIKMAPVISALREAEWARVKVLATAQHRELLDDVLTTFSIVPDADLDVMEAGQSLGELTGRLLRRVDAALSRDRPEIVVAQGDTTTVFVLALCSFYRGIPFAHVEAGLRSFNRMAPFPEEMNRYVASYLGDLHFAPTLKAKANLVQERVDPARIVVTGNTVIDALMQQAGRTDGPAISIGGGNRLVLLTAHRRESFGLPLRGALTALRQIVERIPDVELAYPVHPNPEVVAVANEVLAGRERIHLLPPLDYARFVALLKQSYIVVTDSGGIQEEAPALGKPVLVLRDVTERQESVDAGVAKLVGTDPTVIGNELSRLLMDHSAYRDMARGVSPYGDGRAAGRIVHALHHFLSLRKASCP